MRFLANLALVFHVNFNRVSLHIIKRGNRIKEYLREDYGLARNQEPYINPRSKSWSHDIFPSFFITVHHSRLSFFFLFSFHPCYIPPFHFSCHFLNCWSMHDFPRPESRVFSFTPMLPTQILDSLETL